MIRSHSDLSSLSNAELIARTSDLVGRSRFVEADLLIHLAEIDNRRLYLDRAWPSMFAFCQGELGFSEDVACNRITVARAARKIPAIIEALRGGRVHLAGLRVLAPHLTEENHRALLAEATGKPRRDIDVMAARLAPKSDVPAVIRKLPERRMAPADAAVPRDEVAALPAHVAALPADVTAPSPAVEAPSAILAAAEAGVAGRTSTADAVAAASAAGAAGADRVAAPRAGEHRNRPVVASLSGDRFKVQFTASREFKDKLREAQDLLRHRYRDGDMERILGSALDLLLEKVKKERFAVGRRPRAPNASGEAGGTNHEKHSSASRHVPAAMQRAVHGRDEGRCAFVDEQGRRCGATSALQIDHIDGYARTQAHSIDRLRLLCAAHNQHAADRMYGRAFMERARAARRGPAGMPAASSANPPRARAMNGLLRVRPGAPGADESGFSASAPDG